MIYAAFERLSVKHQHAFSLACPAGDGMIASFFPGDVTCWGRLHHFLDLRRDPLSNKVNRLLLHIAQW